MTQSHTLIDVAHLDSMTSGDTGLAIEVLEIFQHQAEIWSRLLDSSSPRQQWADAAHTLKGASLSIGAQSLADACGATERLGRADDEPSAAAVGVAISEVKTLLHQTLEAVSRLIHKLNCTADLKGPTAKAS